MNILILINDAPYGTEKAYNGFRLAMALQKEHSTDFASFSKGASCDFDIKLISYDVRSAKGPFRMLMHGLSADIPIRR
jgi:hypothetical protein